MRRLAALLAAYALVGSIGLVHQAAVSSVDPTDAEVKFGRLAPGSSRGLNGTNASASVTGTLLSTTTQVWYLNNTNATGASFARVQLVSSSGLANLASLEVGIHNGTAVRQVSVLLGSLTQSGGALVRLEPGSVNRVYATQSVSALGLASGLVLRVVVADDAAESASYAMRASLSVT